MTRIKNNQSNGKKLVAAIKSAQPKPNAIPKALLQQAKKAGIPLTYGPHNTPKTPAMLEDALHFETVLKPKYRRSDEIERQRDKIYSELNYESRSPKLFGQEQIILKGLGEQESKRLDRLHKAHIRCVDAEESDKIYKEAMSGPTSMQLVEQAKNYVAGIIADIDKYIELSEGKTICDSIDERFWRMTYWADLSVRKFSRMAESLVQFFLDPEMLTKLTQQQDQKLALSYASFGKGLTELQAFFSDLEDERHIAMLDKQKINHTLHIEFSDLQYYSRYYKLQRRLQETEVVISGELWPDED